MELFYEMSHKNIYPIVVTYIVLIDGLCKEGKLGSSSMKCPTKLYALILSHRMCLLMVFVRKASSMRSGGSSMKCLTNYMP
jgi:hypothetical protein